LPTNLKDTEVRYGVIDIETFRSKDNADVPKGQLVPYHVGVYTGKANVKNGNTFLTWYYTDYGSAVARGAEFEISKHKLAPP